MPSFVRKPGHRRQAGEEKRPPLLRDFIYLMDHAGLLIVPYDRAALLRDEGTGRVEVTASDGRVGHRAGSTDEYEHGPWIRIAPGVLAHPAHARREVDELVFPGGWRIPFRGTLREPDEEPEDVIEAIGARRDEVLYLQPGTKRRGNPNAGHSIRGARWITDRGAIPVKARSLGEAARQHGGLIQVGRRWINPRRLRTVRPAGRSLVLGFDGGSSIVASFRCRRMLLRGLGIPSLDYLLWQCAEHVGLYNLGLRDFPFEIAEASAEVLHDAFDRDERRLIANLVWQTFRYRQAGREIDYGTTHREFWYHPLLPVLVRAGLVRKVADDEIVTMGRPAVLHTADDHYEYALKLMANMVEQFRLLTFTALGFHEMHAELRRIGARRPDVVLVVEKGSVEASAWALADRFGISAIILGSQPPLVGTEFFATALKAKVHGKVTLVGYVDFDPGGWVVANSFRKQLALFGVEAEAPLFLVRPSRFTEDELRRLAAPIVPRNAARRTELRHWLQVSGGIHGKAMGIHLDHLRPLERVIQAFEEETGRREGAAESAVTS